MNGFRVQRKRTRIEVLRQDMANFCDALATQMEAIEAFQARGFWSRFNRLLTGR